MIFLCQMANNNKRITKSASSASSRTESRPQQYLTGNSASQLIDYKHLNNLNLQSNINSMYQINVAENGNYWVKYLKIVLKVIT